MPNDYLPPSPDMMVRNLAASQEEAQIRAMEMADNISGIQNRQVQLEQIGGWDTSSVTRMDGMFQNASAFNAALSASAFNAAFSLGVNQVSDAARHGSRAAPPPAQKTSPAYADTEDVERIMST